MREQKPLPGRTPEADVLRAIGFWFLNSKEAKDHQARIRKLGALGLISLRPHRTNDGTAIKAYELTDDGLERLALLAGEAVAAEARGHREYFREQARRHRWL